MSRNLCERTTDHRRDDRDETKGVRAFLSRRNVFSRLFDPSALTPLGASDIHLIGTGPWALDSAL
jgi:hypothetical protein